MYKLTITFLFIVFTSLCAISLNAQITDFDELIMHTIEINDSTYIVYSDYYGDLYSGKIFRLGNRSDTVLKGTIKQGVLDEATLWTKKTKQPTEKFPNKLKRGCIDSVKVIWSITDTLPNGEFAIEVKLLNSNNSGNISMPIDGHYYLNNEEIKYVFQARYEVKPVMPGETFYLNVPNIRSDTKYLDILLFCDYPDRSMFGNYKNDENVKFVLIEDVYKNWKNIIRINIREPVLAPIKQE